jgi:GntR family transcriptional regulator / MocR family aminotransferase
MPRKPAPSLLVRVDPRCGKGLQQQIYEGIRQSILSGILQPGARLPSSRALAVDLALSRTTTLLAYEQLHAEGYLSARRGSGSFVARELPDDLLRVPALRPLAVPRHPPLSRRGIVLSSSPPAARRIAGPPRPFRLGVPAVDLFPVRQWAQLASRRLRSVSASLLDYGDVAGLRALREAIADHVRAARGTRCHADQVVVVAGAQRGMDFIMSLLLDPEDGAWIEDPGYPGSRRALLRAGARIVPVRVDEEGLDVEAGARQAGDARLAVVSPSHQFPLGVPMSLPRRLALLKWARRARAWVIEDDYDGEFRYGARPIPCLHGLDGDDRVVYVGTFAKTLFPSLRLGFLIVPPDLTDRVAGARRAGDLHPPLLDQAVLADFMGEGHYERHLRRMRSAYRERLEAVVAAARRHCEGALRVRPTHTGLHLVADLVDADADQVFQEAHARGVEVMPLAAYAMGRVRPANALVLGFGSVRPDRVGAGMERLAAAIEAALAPIARTAAD